MTDRPVALITGGARGIGRAICEALAPSHEVLVGGRDAAAVTAVCAEIEYGARPFVADLTDAVATQQAVDNACLDRLDVLVHSAGVVNVVAPQTSIAQTPREEWSRVLDINVTAVADVTRMLLPALRAAKGHVITINSGSGFRSSPGGAVYAASKFALRAFSDALRLEERGVVRVTSIHPGRVATDMQAGMWADAGCDYRSEDHLQPADVAATVALAVSLPAHASIDELQIRPTVQKNPRR